MSDFRDIDPPADDLETLAAEYVLGLLTTAQLPHVVALRRGSIRFEQAVQQWELRLLPLAESLESVSPSPGVWSAIAASVAPREHRGGTWNSLRFWRGFGLGAGAVCTALVIAFLLPRPPPSPVPVATALLASKTDGIFVATAEQGAAGTRLLISPLQAAIPAGKSAELWLIIPGGKPAALGLLAADRAVAVDVPAARLPADLRSVELAVSIEPPGGSPSGAPTGPVIAAATFQRL